MVSKHPEALSKGLGRFLRSPFVLIFTLHFSLALFLAPGNLGLDSQTRYEVSRSLLSGNGWEASGGGTVLWETEEGVRSYGRFTHGQSLLFLPLEILVVSPVRSVLPGSIAGKAGETIMALLFFPFFAGGAMALLYVFLRQTGNNRSQSIGYTMITGLATPLLTYMASPHEVTQVLFFLLLGLVVGLGAIGRGSGPCVIGAIHLMCLATHLRPTAALECAALTAWMYYIARKKGREGEVVPGIFWFVSGLATAGAVSLAAFAMFNHARFGHPLMTGYHVFLDQHGIDGFGFSLWSGIWRVLVSLDYGWIWFCPLFIAIPFSPWRRVSPPLLGLSVLGWALFSFWVLFFARSVFFSGGPGYAPRFQAHLLPFLLLPIMECLKGGRLPGWLVLLLALSTCQQLAWKTFSPLLEVAQLQSEATAFPEMAELDAPGRIPMRWVNLGRALTGNLEGSFETVCGRPLNELESSLIELDVAWYRAWRFGPAAAMAIGLVAFLALLCAVYSGVLLLRLLRGHPRISTN